MSDMHERMRAVVGRRSFREIADLTDHNSETVRRYLQGASPSVEFVAAFTKRFGVNAHWLLTGAGATYLKDAKADALSDANPAELLTQIAQLLEQLEGRLDRIEGFVQTLEVRVRHARSIADGDDVHGAASEAESKGSGGGAPGNGAQGRAAAVADALPKRPSADADRADA